MALRSGEFVQTRGTLYKPDLKAYCCLGVLAHLVGVPDTELCYYGTLNGCFEPDRRPFPGRIQDRYIDMNDRQFKDFNAIADAIEADKDL